MHFPLERPRTKQSIRAIKVKKKGSICGKGIDQNLKPMQTDEIEMPCPCVLDESTIVGLKCRAWSPSPTGST